MTRLVVATRNGNKLQEIRAILGRCCQYLALNDFPEAPKTVEDADTFAGNAMKKAIELAQWLATHSILDLRPSAVFVLADDSGLEVDALEGEPGVYSARFAAGGGSAGGLAASLTGDSADADNNAKLLRLLNEVPWENRTARFRCVLALTPVLTTTQAGSVDICGASWFFAGLLRRGMRTANRIIRGRVRWPDRLCAARAGRFWLRSTLHSGRS